MLGVRLDEQLEKRLSALAEKTQRSESFLAKEASIRYIEEEERKQRENELWQWRVGRSTRKRVKP